LPEKQVNRVNVNRIKELTPRQEDQLVAFCDEWLEMSLITGPADFEAITPTLEEIYGRAKLPAPTIWRCESPMMMHLIVNLIARMNGRGPQNARARLMPKLTGRVGKKLKNRLVDRLHNQLRGNLNQNLATRLWKVTLHSKIHDSLRAYSNSIWPHLSPTWCDFTYLWPDPLPPVSLQAGTIDKLLTHLEANCDIPLAAKLTDEVSKRTGSNFMDIDLTSIFHLTDPYTFRGSMDASWLAYFLFPHQFMRKMHTKDQLKQLDAFTVMARNAFWWQPYEKVCFVCDRPSELHFDERGRFHNLDGPALAFTEGFALYLVQGVRVPAAVVEQPESITVETIDAEPNAEVRRVMIEQFGTTRFIIESGAMPVHRDKFGTLYRREMAGDEPLVMVKVMNDTREPDGSQREYWLRVPPTMQTAHEAVAWTFDLNQGDYTPLVET
jgi:hypothetical protein